MRDKDTRRKGIVRKAKEIISSPSELESIVEKEDRPLDKVISVAKFIQDKFKDPEDLAEVMKEISDLTLDKFTKLGPDEAKIDRNIIHMKKQYKQMSDDERKALFQKIYRDTGYLPDYNHPITRLMYGALKCISYFTTFRKVYERGYVKEMLELSKQGRVAFTSTHKDMFDPIFAIDAFLKRKLRPPIIHAGANLRGIVNSFFISRFNALFLKRASKKKPHTPLDMLVYALENEVLLEDGENMLIFSGASRSPDGRIPPLKNKTVTIAGQEIDIRGMAKGYMSCLLRANELIDEPMYIVPVNVDSALFPDVVKDFYTMLTTGKKPKINTVRRFFKNARMFKVLSKKTGIVVNYGKPIEIPSYARNTSENRHEFTKQIRQQFKENTTALPEYIMAYSMNYLLKNDPDYHSLMPKTRRQLMHELFNKHHDYLKERHKHMPDIDSLEAFDIAVKFYQDMGILTKDYYITDKFRNMLEYNSNAVEHLYKEELPLTERKLLDRIRQHNPVRRLR